MGSQHPYTSSGSKSRDTRGEKPSQDDIRDKLRNEAQPGEGRPKGRQDRPTDPSVAPTESGAQRER